VAGVAVPEAMEPDLVAQGLHELSHRMGKAIRLRLRFFVIVYSGADGRGLLDFNRLHSAHHH
jgi:hypothetical protein